jgi:hypothetical protein
MLSGIHFLLTYKCTMECEHCFVYSGPFSPGTFTSAQLKSVLDESVRMGTVEWIFFEGGEPFMFYPTLLEGVRLARDRGFKVGIVSNSYWAVSEDDAVAALAPIAELGLEYLGVSADSFHYGDAEQIQADNALAAAKRLGISTSPIRIEKPYVESNPGEGQDKGQPVIGGGAMFKGRAVECLTKGLPTRPWRDLKTCPHEELVTPSRVHVDSYGHVHICQGLSMGNMWRKPLFELASEYDARKHPVCGPLVKGGPAELAREYGVEHDAEYVDECHFCYAVRRALVDKFPEYLAPRQVYGLE